MARVAFVGLGKMGSAMALRLLEAGHRVSIYNRTASRTTPLVERGAESAGSPAQACAAADAVICMVADDDASRQVWTGSTGILAAKFAPDALAIECSTLSYEWVTELAAHAAAHGLRYVDSPVTGLPAAAAAGELTLLVGADPLNLERARPLLSAFSNRIFHFGDIGSGTAYKLIINLIGAVQIASAAEGLALAERAGLDLEKVAEAMATSQAASPQVVRNVRRMVRDDPERDVVFTAALRLKDVEYALRLAGRLRTAAPFGEVARAGLTQLSAQGRSHVNESAIIEVSRSR